MLQVLLLGLAFLRVLRGPWCPHDPPEHVLDETLEAIHALPEYEDDPC